MVSIIAIILAAAVLVLFVVILAGVQINQRTVNAVILAVVFYLLLNATGWIK